MVRIELKRVAYIDWTYSDKVQIENYLEEFIFEENSKKSGFTTVHWTKWNKLNSSIHYYYMMLIIPWSDVNSGIAVCKNV